MDSKKVENENNFPTNKVIERRKRHHRTLSLEHEKEWRRFEEGKELKTPILVPKQMEKSLEKLLYDAIDHGDVSLILSLVDSAPLDINWKNDDEENQTFLHIATRKKNMMVCALLLGKGADISLRDNSGKTPIHYALDSENQQLITLFSNKALAELENERQKQRVHAIVSAAGSKNQFHHSQESENVMMMMTPIKDSKKLSERQHHPKPETVSAMLNQIFEPIEPKSIFSVHFMRPSPVTEMLKISHFQTIYNIFVAVFIIAFANTLMHNYFETGKPLDFSLFFWCFGDFPNAVLAWFVIFCFSFVSYRLQTLLISKDISRMFVDVCHILTLIALYIGIPIWVRYRDYPPATAVAITCEMVRLSMKMHSFIMVNKALEEAKRNGVDDEMVRDFPKHVTFDNFWYFLWAPTLVYQPSYPRTESIRLDFVLRRLSETALCTFFIYAVMMRYCIPHVHDFTGDLKSLGLGIFHVMVPGTIIALLGFYGVLHSWLNAFAEITRFGDRHFYSDWWTSRSWGTYYRKWNYVVHHFLHRHVFIECVTRFNISKNSSMWLTFILSAVVHEYVLAVTFGFYKPILFFMFLIPGVLFVYLTKMFKNSSFWNTFMWLMLIIGHGCLVGLYMRAWHIYYYHYDRWDRSISAIFNVF